ncbi:MAG TPA: transcription antitermination factor NusB [Vicinamibacterales bacterium]|nr:transcription antitermination factor NusB [Vicinamibacterales bacterium]
MNTARLAAARVLLSIERGRTTLAAELERERDDIADPRDRALFMEITAGSLRWRAELDHCIAFHSRRAVSDLMPEVRATLRSGAYQLMHLDRVPSHAAVSESVDVIRALGRPKAAGLVNAVLRKFTGQGARRSLPRRPERRGTRDSALNYLSVTLSHPRWLVSRWLDRLGFEQTERWCQFNNSSPAVTVRLIDGAPLPDWTPARFVPGAFQLPAGALGRLDPIVRDSLMVQDEGSQLVAAAAGVQPGDRVLDLCAAPGGKTIIFSTAAGPKGQVVASDVRPARVHLLRAMIQRAGLDVPVLALDGESGLPFGATFDRVVVDAPCSGLGTLRRDPDIKWTREEAGLPAFAERQARLLDQATTAVRPGGHLVYATCSSEPEENESVIDAFLTRTPAFRLAAVDSVDAQLVTARGFLSTLPPRDELDAFFAAKLVRSGSA